MSEQTSAAADDAVSYVGIGGGGVRSSPSTMTRPGMS